MTSDIERWYSRSRGGGSTVFSEALVKGWLKERGVQVPDGTVVGGAEEAVEFAREYGFPVVLKITGDRVLHKTEVGGVRTGLASESELRACFGEMESTAAAMGARIMVEEEVPPGAEIIVGLQHDPHFGPVLMVGTGGVYTDILKDVSFRMIPVKQNDVEEMLGELKGRALLGGFRGSPPVRKEALVDAVMSIAGFAEEISGFFESADFNPLIASRHGAWVVDAKVVLAGEPREDPLGHGGPRIDHLGVFFNPRSVAVIGASAVPGKIGNVIVDSLVNHEFNGSVYPVNPGRKEILGVKCYPSLEELPEPPDLAVMVIDLERGPGLMRRLAAMGVHNMLVVSGGGKELGGDRERIEKEMSGLSRELDLRIIGPNCIGAFDGRTRFDSFFHHHDRLLRPPAGPLSFITQSGTWGCGFLEAAETVGVAKMVSYGNRVDVDEGDLIAYLADDPATRVIGSYIEGLSDGRKYLAAAGEAIRRRAKPVVAFKTGRTPPSARAAVSHTGAYGGTYGVYKGVFRQHGVIATDSFSELFSVCKALAMQPPARGGRAAMVSNGAGPMVNAIDLFDNKGLELVQLERSSVRKMADHFSFFYLVENPVDVTGSASAEDYQFVIRTLIDDDGVDIIMPYFVFQDTPLDETITERMAQLNRDSRKPIVACSVGGPYTRRMSGLLEKNGIPVSGSVGDWVAAAGALAEWGRVRGDVKEE